MKRLCTFLVLLASACAYGQVGPIAITSAECATIGVGAKVSVITFQVAGTWTGTLQPKITVQGQAAANVQVTPSTSSTAASTVTANGIYTAQVNGADTFQICGNTVASGTANVYLNTSVASKGGGGSGTSGTVTSVATTSPIGGGTITATGTVTCTTCVVASSPGVGLAHFAGSTQTVTSSAVNLAGADVTGILPTANGGTANAFFTVSGPASSAKTFTFPNASATITQTIASGAKALATGAISSAACTSAQTDTATGTATTDAISASFNGDPTAVTGYVPLTTGMLTIIVYPTADTVNFKVCNNTSSSITPGAITLNWRVVR